MGFSKCRGVYEVPDVRVFKAKIADSWEYLAKGAFSAAYGKGRFVWKFNIRTDRLYGGAVDGAFPYLKAIVEGKIRSKHAPKVFRLLYDAKGRFAALMERLEDTVHNVAYEKFSHFRAYVREERWNELRKVGIPESLIAFVKHIIRMFDDYNPDMHGHNIMTRFSGEYVVIDPLSYRRG